MDNSCANPVGATCLVNRYTVQYDSHDVYVTGQFVHLRYITSRSHREFRDESVGKFRGEDGIQSIGFLFVISDIRTCNMQCWQTLVSTFYVFQKWPESFWVVFEIMSEINKIFAIFGACQSFEVRPLINIFYTMPSNAMSALSTFMFSTAKECISATSFVHGHGVHRRRKRPRRRQIPNDGPQTTSSGKPPPLSATSSAPSRRGSCPS